jgi:CPA1 family monovalent cation:H+ antiporter
MTMLHLVETGILLLTVVLALTTVARRLLVPYPILLVLGGLAIAMVPGLPPVRLDPDLVFLVFLPPVLWAAAYFTSLRDFRQNLRPISLLAIGLVVATTAATAAVARALVPGLGWPAALALGAIVSPPDAVAATAVARKLSIPRRVVTVLEGESLVNDATALVLYRSAVAVMVGGSFGLWESLAQFVLAAVSGVVIGIGVGLATRCALRLTDESFSAIAVTLLAPYVAWVAAESLHASAVLACVAGGLYVRQHFSAIVAPVTRIQARAVWDLLIFVLNGVIFILIGLQLATLRQSMPAHELGRLLWQGAVVSGMAIAIRLVWVPIAAYVPRRLSARLRVRDPMPPWSSLFLIGWTGMRGIVSLAAALALPLATAAGAPLPFRGEIIVLTFAVILITLVLQGLSLTPIIRRLDFDDDGASEREETLARERAARAALERVDQLARERWSLSEQIDRMRAHYTQRAQRFSRLGDAACSAETAAAQRRLRHETLSAERRTLIRLRDEGVIGDDVLHRLEYELDVEAIRIGLGEQLPAGNQSATGPRGAERRSAT